MNTRHIAMALASALLTVGLIPAGAAESAVRSAPEGIEVITVVGKRPTQEGIEVITVVGKRPMQEGIEVITVVGKRPAQDSIGSLADARLRAMPEGIEVVTVVAKRPEPTVAGTCVNSVMADLAAGGQPASGDVAPQAREARYANRERVRQAIKGCIKQAHLMARLEA